MAISEARTAQLPTTDAWPTFWRHNKPLYEQHIADGFKFKHGERTAHFVDGNGEYALFPLGYITGIHFHTNGNPLPYQSSVHLGDSWAQRNFKTRQEAIAWALERAAEVLAEDTSE